MLPTASSSFINFELNTETYDAELSWHILNTLCFKYSFRVFKYKKSPFANFNGLNFKIGFGIANFIREIAFFSAKLMPVLVT